jgi:hypothetical protein
LATPQKPGQVSLDSGTKNCILWDDVLRHFLIFKVMRLEISNTILLMNSLNISHTWPEVMTIIPLAFDLLSAMIDPAGK